MLKEYVKVILILILIILVLAILTGCGNKEDENNLNIQTNSRVDESNEIDINEDSINYLNKNPREIKDLLGDVSDVFYTIDGSREFEYTDFTIIYTNSKAAVPSGKSKIITGNAKKVIKNMGESIQISKLDEIFETEGKKEKVSLEDDMYDSYYALIYKYNQYEIIFNMGQEQREEIKSTDSFRISMPNFNFEEDHEGVAIANESVKNIAGKYVGDDKTGNSIKEMFSEFINLMQLQDIKINVKYDGVTGTTDIDLEDMMDGFISTSIYEIKFDSSDNTINIKLIETVEDDENYTTNTIDHQNTTLQQNVVNE